MGHCFTIELYVEVDQEIKDDRPLPYIKLMKIKKYVRHPTSIYDLYNIERKKKFI